MSGIEIAGLVAAVVSGYLIVNLGIAFIAISILIAAKGEGEEK